MKAKGFKTDLVVAYGCTAPNATQFFVGAGIIAACMPPVPTTMTNPANVTTFGPKGKASIKVSVATGDIKVGIKAIDILNNGTPANGINLGAAANRVIVTSGNCAPGLPPQAAPVPGSECTSTDISSLFTAIFSIPLHEREVRAEDHGQHDRSRSGLRRRLGQHGDRRDWPHRPGR